MLRVQLSILVQHPPMLHLVKLVQGELTRSSVGTPEWTGITCKGMATTRDGIPDGLSPTKKGGHEVDRLLHEDSDHIHTWIRKGVR